MGTLNVGTVNAGAGVQLPSYATTNLPTGGIQQGFLAYDSTIGCVKVWNGQKWQKLDEATVNASGGNQVYDFGLYRVHKFTSSGTFNVQDTQNDAKMDFMIVGGGGGGGCSDGNCSNGGGGAGDESTNLRIAHIGAESDSGGAYGGLIGEMGVFNKVLSDTDTETFDEKPYVLLEQEKVQPQIQLWNLFKFQQLVMHLVLEI